jgi:hypothetical protein
MDSFAGRRTVKFYRRLRERPDVEEPRHIVRVLAKEDAEFSLDFQNANLARSSSQCGTNRLAGRQINDLIALTAGAAAMIPASLLAVFFISVASGIGILAAAGILIGGLAGFACLGLKKLTFVAWSERVHSSKSRA